MLSLQMSVLQVERCGVEGNVWYRGWVIAKGMYAWRWCLAMINHIKRLELLSIDYVFVLNLCLYSFKI